MTIKNKVSFSGPDAMTGRIVNVELLPSERLEIEYNGEIIDVTPQSGVTIEGFHTSAVTNGKVSVYAVEHLFSTFAGLGIDTCRIVTDFSTIPILDVCAKKFCELLKDNLDETIKPEVFKPTEKIWWNYQESAALFEPDDHFSIGAFLQFPEPIGESFYRFDPTKENYVNDIAPARTFIRSSCTDEVWKRVRGKYPILPENRKDSPMLIFEGNDWIIAPKEHEPVKHKILDAMGDLMFLGKRIEAKVNLFRPGHEFTRELVKYLANEK